VIGSRLSSTLNVKRRTIIVAVAVGVLALASPYILLFGTIAYDDAREYLGREPFDSAAWRDQKQVESEDPVRLRMVDDLIKSKRLDRLSRGEVEKLLGEPSATNHFQNEDLIYWLGRERRWISVDSEWLAIQLDKDGIVLSYRIVPD
jgi:hypothetical protein